MVGKETRVILAILGVVALVLVGWYIHHQIYSSGYDACQGFYTDAMSKAQSAARKEIVKIGDNYDKEKKKFIHKGDSGHAVGERIGDVLDLLSKRPKN